MLELIVLGQVPGTEIYVSFTDVAIAVIGLFAIIKITSTLIKKYKSREESNKPDTAQSAI